MARMLAHADMLSSTPGRATARGASACASSTREVKPVDELIRFVVGAGRRRSLPDLKRKLPGRGVWVTATRAGGRRGGQAQGCSRAASSATSRAAPDLAAHGRASARARRARCAGDRPQGRPGRDRLRQGRGRARRTSRSRLLHAADGAADGARKLDGRGCGADRRRRWRNRRSSRRFTSAQLDLALGRSNVVHAALLAGPASEAFLARCQRLEALPDRQSGQAGAG